MFGLKSTDVMVSRWPLKWRSSVGSSYKCQFQHNAIHKHTEYNNFTCLMSTFTKRPFTVHAQRTSKHATHTKLPSMYHSNFRNNVHHLNYSMLFTLQLRLPLQSANSFILYCLLLFIITRVHIFEIRYYKLAIVQ